MTGLGDRLNLPVLGAFKRSATPKNQITTRLDEKTAKTKAFDQAWEDCKRLVDVRDKYCCRCCGRKTVKTLELLANRAEHHHIVARSKQIPALLTDVRNVCLLCLGCHQKVTRRKLHVFGKAAFMFELEGKKFLNADQPLEFVA